MNKSIIRYILSRVVQFEGLFLMLPVIVAIIYKEKTGIFFFFTALLCFLIGTLGSFFKPESDVFYAKEGFVTVSLSWILLSLIGAIPFVWSKEIPSFADALFETASGFTTTGATILSDVEGLSKTAQFFRCFIVWIGGMGVLVFIMSVLPLSGSHNMHLMRAESTGADVSKLVPRVKETAKILYSIYIAITLVLITLYLLSGLDLYNALILSFSTVGTGGFANLNASLAGFSKAVQVITIIFMILCGVNFNAYFLILNKKFKDLFKLEEVWVYLAIIFASALIITIQIKGSYPDFKGAFHDALFQVSSIMTTTGYSTVDFNLWPSLSKALLVMLMVIGGCAGSTAGGIKVSRAIILRRTVSKEIEHLTHPGSVKKIKLNNQSVNSDTIKNVQTFITAYLVLIVFSTLLISIDGFDFTTNITAVITAVGNVGPGLSVVGPTGNFGGFSQFSKIILSLDMLTGRLEIFPMLVLFHIGTWRKA